MSLSREELLEKTFTKSRLRLDRSNHSVFRPSVKTLGEGEGSSRIPSFLGGNSRVRFWAARVFLAENSMKWKNGGFFRGS